MTSLPSVQANSTTKIQLTKKPKISRTEFLGRSSNIGDDTKEFSESYRQGN